MTRQAFLDLLERMGWTAAQAFLATLVVTDLSTAKMAGVTALAAAISVVKSFVATRANTPNTAAFVDTRSTADKRLAA